MCGSGVTICATMFTTAVRIQAGIEIEIRAVIIGNDTLRVIPEILGPDSCSRISAFARIVRLVVQEFKSICGIQRSAASVNWCGFRRHV